MEMNYRWLKELISARNPHQGMVMHFWHIDSFFLQEYTHSSHISRAFGLIGMASRCRDRSNASLQWDEKPGRKKTEIIKISFPSFSRLCGQIFVMNNEIK